MPCAEADLGRRLRSRSRDSMKRSLSVFDWLNTFLQVICDVAVHMCARGLGLVTPCLLAVAQTKQDLYDATTELLDDLTRDRVVSAPWCLRACAIRRVSLPEPLAGIL